MYTFPSIYSFLLSGLVGGLAIYSGQGLAKDPAEGPRLAVPLTFRPIKQMREARGLFFLKQTEINGSLGQLPYFRDEETGHVYSILEDCEACLQAINECEDGSLCRIKAVFTEGSRPTVAIREFAVLFSAGETKRARTGAQFTRVLPGELAKLGVKNVWLFGEAWKDSRGVIWGDMAKTRDDSPHLMNQRQAVAYCQSLHAELPGLSDFTFLGEALGVKNEDYAGYLPEVLPSLVFVQNGRTYGRYFWSASSAPLACPDSSYVFSGEHGWAENFFRDNQARLAVRCRVASHLVPPQ